jgi:hypothetical protein
VPKLHLLAVKSKFEPRVDSVDGGTICGEADKPNPCVYLRGAQVVVGYVEGYTLCCQKQAGKNKEVLFVISCTVLIARSTYCLQTRRTRRSAQPRLRQLGLVNTFVIVETVSVLRVKATMDAISLSVPSGLQTRWTHICSLRTRMVASSIAASGVSTKGS